jgi:hypothetical protein
MSYHFFVLFLLIKIFLAPNPIPVKVLEKLPVGVDVTVAAAAADDDDYYGTSIITQNLYLLLPENALSVDILSSHYFVIPNKSEDLLYRLYHFSLK